MRDQKTLDQMRKITQTLYEAKRQHLQKVLTEEAQLRSKISRLNDLDRGRSLDDIAQQILGTDLLWQAWLGRSKTELNMQLARVLAQKEQQLVEVRLGYGKVLAVQELQKSHEKEVRRKASRKFVDQIVEQTTL